MQDWDELDLRKRDSEKKKRKERGRKGGGRDFKCRREREGERRGDARSSTVCSPLRSHSGLVSVIR